VKIVPQTKTARLPRVKPSSSQKKEIINLPSVGQIPVSIPVQIGHRVTKFSGKMKRISVQKIASLLGTEEVTITKLEVTSVYASVPSVPPLSLSMPRKSARGKRYVVGKRKKRRKSGRYWEKTLLASPFLVEESYIKYGKATHPKPTKKLWKMGYRTMFKIPTVELMGKKNRRKKKKKGGRKR